MSKQEEIREWVAKWFQAHERPYTTDTIFKCTIWDSDYKLADQVLSYLHSQGVVIKVDRELPSHLDTDPMYKAGWVDAIGNGYVAVEPIIKVCARCGATRTDNIDSDICGNCADELRMERETGEGISDTGTD